MTPIAKVSTASASISALLADREELLQKAAAVDEHSLAVPAAEREALESETDTLSGAAFALEAVIADMSASSIDEIIGKLEIASEVLLADAGGCQAELANHGRLVLSAIADLRRMRTITAPAIAAE